MRYCDARPLVMGLALVGAILASRAARAQDEPRSAPDRADDRPGRPPPRDPPSQDPPPQQQPSREPGEQRAPGDRGKTVDELMEELLVPDDEDSDLAWLYSDKVYEPSDLGGEPVPAPALPEGGEGEPRSWDPRWRRFELGDYIVTGAALAVAVGATFISPTRDRWRGRVAVDESVRDAIGIIPYEDGVWARDTSDVLLAVNITYPLLIDSLIVTYWYRNSPDVATEMALITAEAMTLASAMHGMTAGFVSRERPYVRNCGQPGFENLRGCSGRKPFRSFFSGHTTMAFAGAGTACSHHVRHDVFGDPLADGIACGALITTAAATGAMRIIGDQHFLTDVLGGMTVGFLSGIGFPWLLHYGPLARQNVGQTGARRDVRFWLVPMPKGAGIGGKF